MEVELSVDAYARLRELAKNEGRSAAELLDQAINELWRARLLARANEAYAALRNDPVAWQEELDERRFWDCTLMDGLEDDEAID
jgi:predicted transcriptional regulator